MKKVKVGLRPIAVNINLPTVLKTTVLPNETVERLFIATQVGEIFYIGNRGELETFLDIRENVLGLGQNGGYDERGLLGLAFHPNFSTNGLFYIHYSVRNTQGSGAPYDNFIPDPCNENTLQLEWINRENNFDHIDTVEEWVLTNNGNKIKKRTLFNLRRPFMNHNGVNTLNFSRETKKLIFSNGDGGSGNDPFNLAQNELEIAGKIIEIDVDKNILIDHSQVVTRFSELPISIQEILQVMAIGIRNPVGIAFQKINNYYEKYVGNVGQDLVEAIYSFTDYTPVKVTDFVHTKNPNHFINLGWRSWEGDFPTSVLKPCPNNEEYEALVIAYYEEAMKVAPKRLYPLACYYHYDERKDQVVGNSLTGIQVYLGNAIPALYGKVIFTDFFSSKPTNVSKGILAYTNSRTFCKLSDCKEIEIANSLNGEPAFYVSLGSNSNQSKLYLGVHASPNVANLHSGAVYEIIPNNES